MASVRTVSRCCHGQKANRWHGMYQYQTPMPTHLADTATTAGAAADKAASNKEAKYKQLANSHIFVPLATQTAGTWNNRAVELVQELGRRMTAVTEDTRETTYLFQRLSVALQRGNAVSFHSTFTTE